MSVAPLHTIVIGAGLSGLTAAYTLAQQGHPVTVLESADVPGGWVRSQQVGPYLLEGGPNSFPSTSSPDLLALSAQLGLRPSAAQPLQKRRYVAVDRQLMAVPSDPLSFLTTPLLSPRDKLRLMQEPWRAASLTDVPVRTWAAHRFGLAVHDRLLAPFLTGVYAGDTSQISTAAVFPKLWAMEQAHGSLVKAFWANRKTKPTAEKPPYALLNYEQGMGSLIERLAQSLPEGSLRLGWSARAIRPALQGPESQPGYQVDCGWRGDLLADQVVIATPADCAARLLKALSPQAAQRLDGIAYEPISVAYVAAPKSQVKRALDGFGMLCRWEKESSPLLGSIWTSALFPARCPADEVLISLFFGGAHHRQVQDWSADQLRTQALEAAQWVLQPKDKASLSYVTGWNHTRAIPQYHLGHVQRIEKLQAQLQQEAPGVVLAGNYLTGINLNQCVVSGQQAASSLMQSPKS